MLDCLSTLFRPKPKHDDPMVAALLRYGIAVCVNETKPGNRHIPLRVFRFKEGDEIATADLNAMKWITRIEAKHLLTVLEHPTIQIDIKHWRITNERTQAYDLKYVPYTEIETQCCPLFPLPKPFSFAEFTSLEKLYQQAMPPDRPLLLEA